MIIKTYEDGSEFTGKHLAVSLALGAVGGLALFAVQQAKEKRFYAKVRKSYKTED